MQTSIWLWSLSTEKCDFSCYISKQGWNSHRWLQPPWMVCLWAWGNSGRKRRPVIYQPSDCSHSLWWALRIWKHRMLPPDSRGTYERNDFSESSLLHLPIHRKVLNFLTQDIRFLPLISICWCSNYLLLVAKLLYNPAPSSPPQTSSFRITWDATSWAWSPKIPT